MISSLSREIVEGKLNEKTMKLDLEKVKVEIRKINQEVKRTTDSIIRSKNNEGEFIVVDESGRSRSTFKEESDG